MSSRSSRTLYVGNLPGDIREREVEDLFSKYGHVAQIDLKIPPRPPGYAFVEFDDARDAEDAIHGRDGYDFDGHRLRVELAHGGRRSTDDARSSYNGGGRGGGRGGGGDRGRGPSRKSEFRVLVTGLPSSASWQDLKDHMRKGGDVCFSQVYRDGRGTTGVVDYTCYEDMKYAVKKLDDTEFRNAFSHGYVRVREYESRKDSRSPSRGRSYSRSCSRSRGRSLSRSRSPKGKSSRRSPAKDRSKSPGSRSKSRSQSPRRHSWLIYSLSSTFADLVQDQDLLYLLFRKTQVRALASHQAQQRALFAAAAAGVQHRKMWRTLGKRSIFGFLILLKKLVEIFISAC